MNVEKRIAHDGAVTGNDYEGTGTGTGHEGTETGTGTEKNGLLFKEVSIVKAAVVSCWYFPQKPRGNYALY